ncbi:response regulator, partial [Parabacteroides sp. OttesenSCG-928-G07]|nr:response regulator [Parabacteroides sp. OttesenSCG-928-G07]
MKVLIVEDETVAYNSLKKILTEIDAEIEVVGITESIEQTVRFLLKNPPIDLIFMDIHLSDGSAFTIFSTINVDIPVIFTTAYDEYAINAFKVNSIDYLLKPIEEEAIIQALSKFRKFNQQDTLQYTSRIPQLIASNKYPEKFLIPHKDKLIPVPINDIACFYTSNEQTRL